MAKQITGTVTSDKADKTIVISVAERRTHPLYKKQYTITTKYIAHDGAGEAKLGDKVVIVETRPISRRKNFKLEKIIAKAGIAFIETDATADVPKDVIEEKIAEQPAKETAQDKPVRPAKKEAA